MGSEIGPKKIQQAVENGFKRTENARCARIMFLRQFVGQYFDASHGDIGTEPLNLIFNAIRVLVPNIVMKNPKHVVEAKYLAHRDYAEMMGEALSLDDKKKKMRDIYRRVIVDAIFLMGILKTGICDSGTALSFDQNDQVDPGMTYTDVVDFDDFVFDPNCTQIEDGLFVGNRITVPRVSLLDSGLYKNDLIESLPSANSGYLGEDRAKDLSARNINFQETGELEDMVEVCELWVPRAKAIVTVPGSCEHQVDDFLRVADYYGPDSGPFTYLRLTPPVPNNPLPISSVGIWHDIHVMANRMAVKIMQQADRQKDIVGYKRTAADDAQEALDASDGEAVAMDDPEGVKTFSFGGQQTSNESHLGQLQMWFNMMASNPQGLSGTSMNAGSATEAEMLNSNSQIGLEDMTDAVYGMAAEEADKRKWYFHNDPMIEVPMIRRVRTQPQYGPTAPGGVPQITTGMMQPPEQEVQVYLTPEARCGDALDFHLTVEPQSMARKNQAKQLADAMAFAIKILPAAATAAQTCLMMGVPFSFPRFAVRMAKEAGITWMDEVFQDPEFQMKCAMMMMRGPQLDKDKGAAMPQGGGGDMAAIMQNGQPGQVGATMTPDQQTNRDQQMGAAPAQAGLGNRDMY